MRLIKLGLCAAAFAAATAFSVTPAQAASLVECESEGGWFDCYLPSGYYGQKWTINGVYKPAGDNHSSYGEPCTAGVSYNVRVRFDGGSSVTNIRCR